MLPFKPTYRNLSIKCSDCKPVFFVIQGYGFTLGKNTEFTSIDDQARQVNKYIQEELGGHPDIAYGLSLGGRILSRILERDEVPEEVAIRITRMKYEQDIIDTNID